MNGFDCTQFQRWLDDGALGAGDDSATSPSARAHADGCMACSSLLAADHSVERLFAASTTASPAPVSADFVASVMARVARTPQLRPVLSAAEPAMAGVSADTLPWWVRAIARPEGAVACAIAGLALLFSPQMFGLARVAPQWSSATLTTLTLLVSPWLAPILERLAARPLVGFGVALALLPLVAVATWALYRLGVQLARVRLVPAAVRGGRA